MDARPHDADDPTGDPVEEPTDPPRPEPADGSADGPDIEKSWAEIVARLGDLDDLDTDVGAGTPPRRAPGGGPERRAATEPWPTEGPRREGAGEADDDTAGRAAAHAGGPAGPTGPRAWAPDPELEEAEEHFHPPDPGPVLTGDPLLTMAWSVVVGVPVLLLVAVLVWRDMPSVVLQVAGVAFVLALALLVRRMPDGDEPPDGPGAVV